MLNLIGNQLMIADLDALVIPATLSGMEIPPTPDNFHGAEWPHFALYVNFQLCRITPTKYPSAILDNACIISSLTDDAVFNVTHHSLEQLGCK